MMLLSQTGGGSSTALFLYRTASSNCGEGIWAVLIIAVLIPVRFLFWDGDEEFPPSANILFQDTIAQWTHPESVPTLAQIGTERLIQQSV